MYGEYRGGATPAVALDGVGGAALERFCKLKRVGLEPQFLCRLCLQYCRDVEKIKVQCPCGCSHCYSCGDARSFQSETK